MLRDDSYKRELARLEERYEVVSKGDPLREKSSRNMSLGKDDDYQLSKSRERSATGPLMKAVTPIERDTMESPQQYDKLQTLKTLQQMDTMNYTKAEVTPGAT